MTKGIDNVKIDNVLTFGMPKKVFSLKSFTEIEWVCVALLGLKAGQGKMKISVHLLRSLWLSERDQRAVGISYSKSAIYVTILSPMISLVKSWTLAHPV